MIEPLIFNSERQTELVREKFHRNALQWATVIENPNKPFTVVIFSSNKRSQCWELMEIYSYKDSENSHLATNQQTRLSSTDHIIIYDRT